MHLYFVGKHKSHVSQLISLDLKGDPLPEITEANKRSIRRFQRWNKWKRSQQSYKKVAIGWKWQRDFCMDEFYSDFEDDGSKSKSL